MKTNALTERCKWYLKDLQIGQSHETHNKLWKSIIKEKIVKADGEKYIWDLNKPHTGYSLTFEQM